MSFILVTSSSGRTRKIHFGMLLGISLVTISAVALLGAGYIGMHYGQSAAKPEALVERMQKDVQQQRDELSRIKLTTEENMNALAVRMGQMQAHVIRLDALGERLIDKANLRKGEFDFENPPGQGGPEAGGERGKTMSLNDFVASLNALETQLDHRSLQLGVLETLLMNRDLQDEVYPAGRPVRQGWVSSYFGFRTDPFNGRIAQHDGIDIAGKMGTEIIAVAAGVVTWAGPRFGYGNLVEINHGNGYVTRYAHNQEIFVRVGDTIKKGQRLSAMGSSGRSTGPHVHFEVIKNGRVVDPMHYMRAEG